MWVRQRAGFPRYRGCEGRQGQGRKKTDGGELTFEEAFWSRPWRAVQPRPLQIARRRRGSSLAVPRCLPVVSIVGLYAYLVLMISSMAASASSSPGSASHPTATASASTASRAKATSLSASSTISSSSTPEAVPSSSSLAAVVIGTRGQLLLIRRRALLLLLLLRSRLLLRFLDCPERGWETHRCCCCGVHSEKSGRAGWSWVEVGLVRSGRAGDELVTVFGSPLPAPFQPSPLLSAPKRSFR